MIKTITKVCNSQGLIFDAALMDLAHLNVGDHVNVTVHEGGAIVLTPIRPSIEPEQAATAARRLIRKNRVIATELGPDNQEAKAHAVSAGSAGCIAQHGNTGPGGRTLLTCRGQLEGGSLQLLLSSRNLLVQQADMLLERGNFSF